MKLISLLSLHKDFDMDAYDNEWDVGSCVCWDSGQLTSEDLYDKFCVAFYRSVSVETFNESCLTLKVSDLVKSNKVLFRAYMKNHWKDECQFDDDEDEFVYQWVRELFLYLDGNACDSQYKLIIEEVFNIIEKETPFFTEVKEICGQEVVDKIKSLNWDPVKEKETKFELDVDQIIRLFNAGVYHGVEGSKAKNFWNKMQEISPKDPKQYLVKRTKGNSDQTYFQLLEWDGEHWITGIHDPLYDVIVEWLDITLL